MMYIEHTPHNLEDKLKYILRNSNVPSSSEAVLAAAHVQETEAAAEEASAAAREASATEEHIQLRAHADLVAYKIAGSKKINSGKAFENGERDNQHKKRSEFAPQKHRTNSTPLKAAQGAGREVSAKVTAPKKEEEEEENYEIFDVVEDCDVEANKTIFSTSVVRTEEPTTSEVFIEIEEEGDDFEYILTQISKQVGVGHSQAKKLRPPALITVHNDNNIKEFSTSASNCDVPRPAPRSRRPVPAAIPISFLSNAIEKHQFRERKALPGVRLLNGNLPIFKRCNSLRSDSSFDSKTSTTYSYVQGDSYCYNHDNGVCLGEVFESDNRHYYYDENCNEEAEEEEVIPEGIRNCGKDSQMGIDIFNRIRRLLNFNSNSNYDTHEEGNRKRRTEQWTSETVGPRHFKYRKVENRFPKVYTHTLEDDDLEMFGPSTSSLAKEDKQFNLQKSPCLPHNSSGMTQHRSLISVEKPKLRKSMFSAPPVTHKLIKNTPYADVEFSDDDEPELIKGFGIGGGRNCRNVTETAKNSPRVYNIPISHRAEEHEKFSMKPPPPLIEASTGSILASSLMPELNTAKRKPDASYSDILRQNMHMPINGGHALGGVGRSASSISSSGASTSASVGIMNGLSNARSNLWLANARSILVQEKETEEREKYQQLLEQVAPRLYNITDNSDHPHQLSKNAHNLYTSSSQRRRSALLVAAANSTAHSYPSANRKPFSLQSDWKHGLKRPPLSSTTVNLDDDDEEDDVTITGVTQLKSHHSSPRFSSGVLPTVVLDDEDDDDISEIIDLDEDERKVLSACTKLKQDSEMGLKKENKDQHRKLPFVEPVNTLKERFSTSHHLKDNWYEMQLSKWTEKKRNRLQEVRETVDVVEKLAADRRAAEIEIQERLRKFQIVDPELLVIDDFPEPVVEEEPEFIELTPEHQARIKAAICGPPDQVLVTKFNLNITRRDIHTLLGNSWLNDEVINFYMNLLTERGEKKHDSHGLPRVYAMNTFFIPRLLQAGHSGVKRWTRKVDIFAKDVLPVPVHVGGVHWCMAIIHLKNRTIKYYDSMGTPNPNVLKALEQYLKEESLDKRRQPFDTSQFDIESVRDVPRQMNGSDCGVFSCMFAEYITRNKEITFSQQNMEYFRHKMVLEIVQGELLH